MARLPRIKSEDSGGWYHLYASVAGFSGDYSLSDPAVRYKLLSIIQFYTHAYFCGVASFQLMGNHYHLVARFDLPRKLSQEELWERALRLYPRSHKQLAAWPKSRWKRLQERIFDVSECMRNIQGAFASWYNRTHNRKGRFWAERFKSTLLASPEAVRECVLYIELNAVRAGLVARPEDYVGGSLYLREIGKDDWLIPLQEIMPEPGAGLYERFKELIYHRGAVITKENQRPLSPEVLASERARGFARSGLCRKRLRYFTDGLLLGGELLIREKLAALRRSGHYLRRKNPSETGHSALFQLREQRSHFVDT